MAVTEPKKKKKKKKNCLVTEKYQSLSWWKWILSQNPLVNLTNNSTFYLLFSISLFFSFSYCILPPLSCLSLSPFLLNWSLWPSETQRKFSVIFFLFAQNEWKDERCDSLRAGISDSNYQAQACHDLGQPHWYSLCSIPFWVPHCSMFGGFSFKFVFVSP